MVNKRYELQKILETILGSKNVYYQPPSNIKMKYPAIVYNRKDIANDFANNNVYLQNFAYELTVIDKNPDSKYVSEVSKLPSCSFDRHFVNDNLNHDVFTIYY